MNEPSAGDPTDCSRGVPGTMRRDPSLERIYSMGVCAVYQSVRIFLASEIDQGSDDA